MLTDTQMALSDFPIGSGIASLFSVSIADRTTPMADRVPNVEQSPHMSAPQMGKYLRSYADHFDLYRNIEFGKSITKLERDHRTSQWLLHIADDTESPYAFDKVVWATGQFLRPKHISIPGQDQFSSPILHSQQVRHLEDFRDKNVVVLGMGNTAADVAVGLLPYAKRVCLSHRRGANIMCRTDPAGLPGDILQTPVTSMVIWWIEQYMPSLASKLLDMVFASNFKKKYGNNDPAWGFAEKPSIGDGLHTITCNDGLIPSVRDGKLLSKPGIKRVTGPTSLELDNGEVLEDIDAIITCTGYANDMVMLSEAVTYTEPANANAPPIPNLYMNIFPPQYADSIAVVSFTHVNGAQPPARELTAMAVAQVWAGNSALPSEAEMENWTRKHDRWRRPRIVKEPNLHQGDVLTRPWMQFLHEAAGTDMFDHIGWGRKAWKLWWSDRELYNALAHGPATAHGHRLFETGKRKVWAGARKAVVGVAAEVAELKAGKQKSI